MIEKVIDDARRNKCFSLYLSPPSELPTSNLPLTTSHRHQYPEATRIIDLTKSEEDILAQMKPKGRYNIRVAQKHGVTIQQSTDISAFYELLQETSQRDRFTALSKAHYQAFLTELKGSFLLLAHQKGTQKPIAGLLGVIWNNQATYYYGASSYAHRASMAPYLLQWEAMRHCKGYGCSTYDLFGIAPPNAQKKHPWRGVSAFKEKFGGKVILYPQEQKLILKPITHFFIQLKRKFL